MSRTGVEQVRQQAGSYELRPIDIITDGLGEKYAALAKSDSSLNKAATLFADTEAQLEKGNATSEVVDNALEALGKFRAKKNADGVCDSVRLVVHAQRAKAEGLIWAGDSSGTAQQALKKARVLVNAELELAQENKNGRREAAMLLSLAELAVLDGEVMKKGGNNKDLLKEAEALAEDAASKFQTAKDSKMQVLALLALSRLRRLAASQMVAGRAGASFQGALDDAKKAKDVAKQAKDSRGEALAVLHIVAAQLDSGKEKEANETMVKEQVNGAGGVKKFHAALLCKLSQVKLMDATAVLKMATTAHGTFQELKYGKGYEAASLGAMVDALIELGQLKKALDTAQASVKELKARDMRECGRAMHHLVHAMVANGQEQEGMKVAEEAVEINCRDLADAHSAVVLQLSCAQIYLKANKYRQAADSLSRAEDGLMELDDSEGSEALAKFIASLQGKIRDADADERKKMRAQEPGDSKKAKRDADEPLVDYDPDEVGKYEGDDILEHAHSFLVSYQEHMKNGSVKEALKAATIAVDLYYDNEGKQGEAQALLGVAAAHISLGNVRPGMFAAKSALENFRELDDRAGIAEALHALATLNNHSGNARDALAMAHEALGMYQGELGDGHGMLKMYFSIIDAYAMELEGVSTADKQTKDKYKNSIEKALSTAKKAANLSMEFDELTEGCGQHYLATGYNLAGKPAEAVQACEEARTLFARCEEANGQVQALSMMGEALFGMSKRPRAQNALNEALNLANANGMKEEAASIQEMLGRIAEAEAAANVRMVAMPMGGEGGEWQQQQWQGDGGAASAAGAGAVEKAYAPPDTALVSERIALIARDMTGDDDFDADTPFMDAGIDSLASVELRTSLQKSFGVSLPSTVMFNYPTRASIADFIVEEMIDGQVTLS